MNSSQIREELASNPRALQLFAPYLLNRISHRYYQTIHAELRSVGLTLVQLRTIVVLAAFDELTVKELCVHAMVKQPTMSRALDRMEKEGLVVRSNSTNDRRVRFIRLTEAGRRVFEQVWPVMDRAHDFLFRALSEREREELARMLSKVLEQIRRHS